MDLVSVIFSFNFLSLIGEKSSSFQFVLCSVGVMDAKAVQTLNFSGFTRPEKSVGRRTGFSLSRTGKPEMVRMSRRKMVHMEIACSYNNIPGFAIKLTLLSLLFWKCSFWFIFFIVIIIESEFFFIFIILIFGFSAIGRC